MVMEEDVIGSLSEDTMTFWGSPWAQQQPAVSNTVFRFFHKRLCFYDEADMFGLTDLSGFVIGDQVEGNLLPFDDGNGSFGADGAADEGGLLVGKADEAADGGFAFGETFLHRIAGGFFHESREDGGGEDGERAAFYHFRGIIFCDDLGGSAFHSGGDGHGDSPFYHRY